MNINFHSAAHSSRRSGDGAEMLIYLKADVENNCFRKQGAGNELKHSCVSWKYTYLSNYYLSNVL